MAKRASTIIAETYGMDSAEVVDYRYQETRTRGIYNFSGAYHACGQRAPKEVFGEPWELAKDQFFAKHAGTKLWIAKEKRA
jgi:hypothetical protein